MALAVRLSALLEALVAVLTDIASLTSSPAAILRNMMASRDAAKQLANSSQAVGATSDSPARDADVPEFPETSTSAQPPRQGDDDASLGSDSTDGVNDQTAAAVESDDKSFIIAAVKELFKQINEGKVHFAEDRVPQTLAEVRAIRFDDAGEPVYETIGPLVRALARGFAGHQEWEERRRKSPVHEFLGEPVAVTEDVLKDCGSRGSFSPLAFELYRETVAVLSVCSHAYFAPEPSEIALSRNQAICAGLLVRITKYMVVLANAEMRPRPNV